jgi:xylulokinase
MSVVLSAASAVDFVSKITGFEQPKDLYEAVAAARTPSHGPIFLPYLSGERTPHNDPAAKGAFFGMTHDDSPVTLAQAALEGVAFALADGIDVLRVNGSPITTLSVIGGGAQSAWWGEVISSALNMPLTYRQAGNIGPAFGAARLARLSLGQDKFEEICTPPPVSHIIEPNSNMNDLYETRKVTYRQLYQSTKHLT